MKKRAGRALRAFKGEAHTPPWKPWTEANVRAPCVHASRAEVDAHEAIDEREAL